MKPKLLLAITFSLCLPLTSTLASSNTLHPDSKQICGAKNCEKVRMKLKRSAYRGSIAAQKLLAIMYLDGIGKEKKPQMAVKFLRKAAKAGDADAALMLAHIYKQQRINDPDKYNHWLNQASLLSGKSTDELAQQKNVLTFQYDAKVTLTQVADKIAENPNFNPSYGGGSHILSQGCSREGVTRCKSYTNFRGAGGADVSN